MKPITTTLLLLTILLTTASNAIPAAPKTIRIEGNLLMLDDQTPHIAVPVQAVRDGKVVATTLSTSRANTASPG